jgi:hypothetical protein
MLKVSRSAVSMSGRRAERILQEMNVGPVERWTCHLMEDLPRNLAGVDSAHLSEDRSSAISDTSDKNWEASTARAVL